MRYQFPFNNPNLADGYGSLAGGRRNPHNGLDFAQPTGKPIPCVADGVVVEKSNGGGQLGYYIVVKHPDGKFSGYCHSNQQSPLAVGQRVFRGQTLNTIGSRGYATGPHLHLTMGDDAASVASRASSFNPYPYINARLSDSNPDPGPDPDPEPNPEPPPVLDPVPVSGLYPVPVSTWLDDPAIKAQVEFTSRTGRVAIEAIVNGFGKSLYVTYSISGLVTREKNVEGKNLFYAGFMPEGQIATMSRKWIREDLPRDRPVTIAIEVRNGGSGYAGVFSEDLTVQNLIAEDALPDFGTLLRD